MIFSRILHAYLHSSVFQIQVKDCKRGFKVHFLRYKDVNRNISPSKISETDESHIYNLFVVAYLDISYSYVSMKPFVSVFWLTIGNIKYGIIDLSSSRDMR